MRPFADAPVPEEDAATGLLIDLKGLKCPLPALRTAKAVAGLPIGGRLTVEATDPMAGIDIPHVCSENGHRLVARETEGRVLRFTIERGR
ncbi:MAG TPA: sulfurtransferase TusA family protein [Methylomirabilota bacterium]|nr:sulfurtransferase TusA family protein [Methylomirabilota bacterium]